MRNVVFSAPFPLETTMRFARAASRLLGVRLLGLFQELPAASAQTAFHDLIRVDDVFSAESLARGVAELHRRNGPIHRLIGVLETLQVPLAQARAEFAIPGTRPEVADLFRDKARMKDRLRENGIPVARHRLLTSPDEARTFSAEVPFPWVLKPPAGMGSKSTFRVESLERVAQALSGLRVGPKSPILAEEFLTGDEGSFDAVVQGGRVVASSISHYAPNPLTVLENPWVQWCCILPRSLAANGYQRVTEVGTRAIEVLGLEFGMTHMEWFRRPDGTVAVGEIAQRPPGANITPMMGLAHDVDPFRAWARAEIDGAFDGPWQRRWSVGCAFLRGPGQGRVSAITGVAEAQKQVGAWVQVAKLPSLGAPKSASYEGDGYVIVRAPETDVVERSLKTVIETVLVHYS